MQNRSPKFFKMVMEIIKRRSKLFSEPVDNSIKSTLVVLEHFGDPLGAKMTQDLQQEPEIKNSSSYSDWSKRKFRQNNNYNKKLVSSDDELIKIYKFSLLDSTIGVSI